MDKIRIIEFFILLFTCISYIIEEVLAFKEVELRVKVDIHKLNLNKIKKEIY